MLEARPGSGFDCLVCAARSRALGEGRFRGGGGVADGPLGPFAISAHIRQSKPDSGADSGKSLEMFEGVRSSLVSGLPPRAKTI